MNDQSLQTITLISTDGAIQNGLRSISAVLKKEGWKVNVIFLRSEVDEKVIYRSPNIMNSIKDIVKDSLLVGISTNIQVGSPLAIYLFTAVRLTLE